MSAAIAARKFIADLVAAQTWAPQRSFTPMFANSQVTKSIFTDDNALSGVK
jgi:hypothetical protein